MFFAINCIRTLYLIVWFVSRQTFKTGIVDVRFVSFFYIYRLIDILAKSSFYYRFTVDIVIFSHIGVLILSIFQYVLQVGFILLYGLCISWIFLLNSFTLFAIMIPNGFSCHCYWKIAYLARAITFL